MRTSLSATHAVEVEPIRSENPRAANVLRRFALKACVAFTLTVILLLAGELFSWYGLRRYPEYRSDRTRDNPIYKNYSWGLEYWKEHADANRSQYEPYVMWRHAPYHGALLNVDPEGIRETANSDCVAGAYTIWMFGDSSLWGSGVPDWATLASALAKRYSEGGRKVCVRNYGEIGWVTTQEVLALSLYLKNEARKPDLVIFYDGGADVFASYTGGQVDVHQNFQDFKQTLEGRAAEKRGGLGFLRHTNSANFLEMVADKLGLRRSPVAPQRTAEMAQGIANSCAGNMQTVEALAAKFGFRYIYFLSPTIWTGNKVLTSPERFLLWHEEAVRPGMGALLRSTYDLLPHNSPNFVRLDHVLDKQTDTAYVGTTHTGPAANEIIADEMFKILRKRGM